MQRYFGPTAVDGTMAASQVARAALRKHFTAMLANEEGTIEGSDPEKLHDMRVATRRMRAAFGVFGSLLTEETRLHEKDLKWIGSALGGVRDLDVQIEHQRQWAEYLGSLTEVGPWLDWLVADRESQRKKLIASLSSPRYARFVDQFGELLLHEEPTAQEPPIIETAPDIVKKRWRKLRKAVEALDGDSPNEDFHNARILAKRLRYSIEFVAPVYGPVAKEVAAAIAKMQDILGLHQDCTVTKQMIKEKLAKGWKKLPPTTCFELGRLSCHADSIMLEQRAHVAPAFQSIRQGVWPQLKEQMRVRALTNEIDVV